MSEGYEVPTELPGSTGSFGYSIYRIYSIIVYRFFGELCTVAVFSLYREYVVRSFIPDIIVFFLPYYDHGVDF